MSQRQTLGGLPPFGGMIMKETTIRQGRLTGVELDGYTLFKGVPYAKPPVGALRWRAPQEPEPWGGVYRADTWPCRSMQGIHADGFYDKEFYDETDYQTPMSEDSLYLNIWTPAKKPGERLPVAFWIHGGAFMGGFGHEKEFDGAAYCKRGVILVTINYRLGPLGFLAHPWLSQENQENGGQAVSGNYGILDQIAALKWVRENIKAFGGDPDNITVFGQSAGCMSVQTLVSSPLTRGLIAKAILQSGVGLSYDHTLSKAELEGVQFAVNAEVESLDELRALSFEQVMAAAGPIIMAGLPTMELAYTPIIDGVVLEDGYDATVEQGKIHDIPYIVGSTMNDIATDLGEIAKGNLGKVYDGSREWCRALLNNGRTSTWHYYFVRQLPGDDAGAFHSSELWYTFGTYGRCWRPMTEGDRALSEQMVDYWTNFMKTGNPNDGDLPRWEAYRDDGDTMIFDA